MNQILRKASRATLARCSRSGTVLTAGNVGLPSTLPVNLSSTYISRRFNSGGVDKEIPSFTSVPLDLSFLADGNAVDGLTAVAVEAAPKVNFVIEHIMSGIDMIHMSAGIPYWGAICVATVAIRVLMLPIAIKTIKGTAKMAQMTPVMNKIKDREAVDPNRGDPDVKKRYQAEYMALFKKYDANPIRSIIWPLSQFPVFIAFFMALRDMGVHYPGFATGGDFWFTDLSSPDTTMILPIFNSLSFLLMIELGADGMRMQQAQQFQWVMRGLAIVMVPLTMNMPQGLFVYWSCNNVLSLLQTTMMKKKPVRDFFGIPEAPPAEDTPQLKIVNPVTQLTQALAKERSVKSDAKAEILYGAKPTAVQSPVPPTPPPVSFAQPPRKVKRPSIKKE